MTRLTHCNKLQQAALHCNTLHHTAPHCITLHHTATRPVESFDAPHILQHTATHCNTLQHTATHCNTLQHTATHRTTLHHTATPCTTLQQVRSHHSMLCALSQEEGERREYVYAVWCSVLQRVAVFGYMWGASNDSTGRVCLKQESDESMCMCMRIYI